jgi:hypothetical protein
MKKMEEQNNFWDIGGTSKWILLGLTILGILVWVLNGFKKTKKRKIKLRTTEKMIGKHIDTLIKEDIPKVDKVIEELEKKDDEISKKAENDFKVIKKKLEEIKEDDRDIPLGNLVTEDDDLWDLT